MAQPPDVDTPLFGTSGLLMGSPERAFVVALRYGWEWLKVNPRAWESILRQADAVELTAIRELFGPGGKHENPIIRTGFPTAPATAPQIIVLTETEAEETPLLGDETGEDDEITFDSGKLKASIRSQVITVTVYATHPDVALYLSRAVDSLLTSHALWFIRSAGLLRADFQSIGAPMAMEREPDMLWMREIRWAVSALGGTVLPIAAPTEIQVRAAVAGGRVRIG